MPPIRNTSVASCRFSVYNTFTGPLQKTLEKIRHLTSEPSNSSNTASSPFFISHFKHYLDCPFFLIRERGDSAYTDFTLMIRQNTWAQAVLKSYHRDMRGIVITLSEAVFCQDDLDFRNSGFLESAMYPDNPQFHQDLYNRKKEVIKDATLWLWNNVGSEADFFQYIYKYPNSMEVDPDISEALQQEIESGFRDYSTIRDQSPFLLSQGISEDQQRIRIYSHIKNNAALTQYLSENFLGIRNEGAANLDMRVLFETILGFCFAEEASCLSGSEILGIFISPGPDLRSCSKIFQLLVDACFRYDENYAETFFGPLQVGRLEFSILEQRRQGGIVELTRSLCKMIFRRYNDFDPENLEHQDRFLNLKTNPSAALLLVEVMRVAKALSMVPLEMSLSDWSNQEVFENFEYPSIQEFELIFERLKQAWGESRFSDTDAPQNIIVYQLIVPAIEETADWFQMYCHTDAGGQKYLLLQDQPAPATKFFTSLLRKTCQTILDTDSKKSNAIEEQRKLKEKAELTEEEITRLEKLNKDLDGRTFVSEYQGARVLLLEAIGRDEVEKMDKNSSRSPKGKAVTDMIRCLKSNLPLFANDNHFITQAENSTVDGQVISVSCSRQSVLESTTMATWLFCEYPREVKKMKR